MNNMNKIGKNGQKQFELEKNILKEKTRFLENSLEIPFMEAKGAYHILVKVLELEHIKENIFENKFGRKFALTKYGFEDCVQYNYKYECNKLEKIIQNHTEARLANFQGMKAEIEELKKSKSDKSLKEELLDILGNEDNLYTKVELIEKLVNY